MTTYYKAVRHDYGSFHNPDFKYGPVGTLVEHPDYRAKKDARGAEHYISISTEPADCTGFQWRVGGKDSRLLVVEPVGRVYTPDKEALPNKRAVKAVRVVGELPISAAFGPNADQVVRFLGDLNGLTSKQWAAAWDAAWDAARDAAGDAARDAAGDAAEAAAEAAARDAAWDADWDVAGYAVRAAGAAARALVVRDKITAEQFEILVKPMRAAGVVFE